MCAKAKRLVRCLLLSAPSCFIERRSLLSQPKTKLGQQHKLQAFPTRAHPLFHSKLSQEHTNYAGLQYATICVFAHVCFPVVIATWLNRVFRLLFISLNTPPITNIYHTHLPAFKPGAHTQILLERLTSRLSSDCIVRLCGSYFASCQGAALRHK